MVDPFENHASKLESPFRNAMDVTPSDAVDLPTIPRALFCTGSGTVRVTVLAEAPYGPGSADLVYAAAWTDPTACALYDAICPPGEDGPVRFGQLA